MHRIVYLERESIIAEVGRPDCPHHWVEYPKTVQVQVEERLAGASIAIVNKLLIDGALIARLPQLQMVAVAATGTNNVDLEACLARGIVGQAEDHDVDARHHVAARGGILAQLRSDRAQRDAGMRL